jgi:hypothetical protein
LSWYWLGLVVAAGSFISQRYGELIVLSVFSVMRKTFWAASITKRMVRSRAEHSVVCPLVAALGRFWGERSLVDRGLTVSWMQGWLVRARLVRPIISRTREWRGTTSNS